MTLRRAVFWIHLTVGVAAAIVILIMAATGVILTYEAQFNRLALGKYRSVVAHPYPAALPLGELIDRITSHQSAGSVASVALRRDLREPAIVRLDDGATVYADRFTGEALGDGNTPTRRFFRTVTYWHRWFALEGEYRIIGRTFTATANLGFLFLLISGFYIWWPSTRSRAAWRQALWFRRGLRGRARNFNWHSVIGFWSVVPLAVIVASGATISYRWAGDLVYRLVGEAPPSQASPASDSDAGGELAVNSGTEDGLVMLQTLAERAALETPGWQSITISLDQSALAPVLVTVDRGTGRQPSQTEDLLFDRATGELIQRAGYPTFSRGHKIRRWLRFAHTGEVYGVIGQSVAGVVSLGVAVMVWTGLAMSWRRFFGPASRKGR